MFPEQDDVMKVALKPVEDGVVEGAIGLEEPDTEPSTGETPASSRLRTTGTPSMEEGAR